MAHLLPQCDTDGCDRPAPLKHPAGTVLCPRHYPGWRLTARSGDTQAVAA